MTAEEPVVTDPAQWAVDVFARFAPEHRAAVYRELSLVLHPDVGGDPVMWREMDDAFNR